MTRRQFFVLIPAVVLLTPPLGALAADDLEALQSRFRERAGQLRKLKDAGKIGETWEGYVEAVKAESRGEVAGIVGQENDDRRKLYQILAKEEGITPDEVAKNNAVRNFNKAKKGEYLKGPDGQWTQK